MRVFGAKFKFSPQKFDYRKLQTERRVNEFELFLGVCWGSNRNNDEHGCPHSVCRRVFVLVHAHVTFIPET